MCIFGGPCTLLTICAICYFLILQEFTNRARNRLRSASGMHSFHSYPRSVVSREDRRIPFPVQVPLSSSLDFQFLHDLSECAAPDIPPPSLIL